MIEREADMQSFDQTWEKIHAERAWGKYPSEPVIRFVARNYYNRDRKEVKILDFGCGAGCNTWFLAREGFDTYAFDGSESAIARVQDMLQSEGLQANVSVQEGADLKYENNFFDCVIDNVTIYANRMEAIRVMYRKIYDMLKNGGKVFSVVFAKGTTGYGTGTKLEEGTYTDIEAGCLEGKGISHYFDKEEAEDILKEIGYKNIRVDSFRFTDDWGVVDQLLIQAEK